jgi:hypothetical protein
MVLRSEGRTRAQRKRTNGDQRHDHLSHHFLPPLLDGVEDEVCPTGFTSATSSVAHGVL